MEYSWLCLEFVILCLQKEKPRMKEAIGEANTLMLDIDNNHINIIKVSL